jgi:hypothetical protein
MRKDLSSRALDVTCSKSWMGVGDRSKDRKADTHPSVERVQTRIGWRRERRDTETAKFALSGATAAVRRPRWRRIDAHDVGTHLGDHRCDLRNGDAAQPRYDSPVTIDSDEVEALSLLGNVDTDTHAHRNSPFARLRS